MTCPHRLDVAAYTLGTLDSAERDTTAAHLPGCPECREVLDSVAGLPGLLVQVDLADLLAVDAADQRRPDPAMLQRLLSEAGRRRTARPTSRRTSRRSVPSWRVRPASGGSRQRPP